MNLERIKFSSASYKPVSLGAYSKGNQTKYLYDSKWIKANYLGYEDYSEVITSILLSYSNVDNYISYHLCSYNGEDGCYSENFLQEKEHLVTPRDILALYKITHQTLDNMNSIQERFNLVVETVKEHTGLDITTYLSNLLAFDSLILNEDRHLNNIALIYNKETDAYREAPIFDNGAAFLSDTKDYPISIPIDINIRHVKAKPFSTSFKKQYRILQPTIKFDKIKVEELIMDLTHSDNITLQRIGFILLCNTKIYPELFEVGR